MIQSPPPPTNTTQALSGGEMVRATGIVVLGFILSRVLGLLRELIIAEMFGATPPYDSFVAASRPPETIFLVVAGGAIGSAFIPTFMDYIAGGKRDEAYRLTSTVVNLLLLLMIVLCGLVAIFAKPITGLLLHDYPDPSIQPQTARLLRIMLLTPIIFSVSGLMMGFLQAHQRFLLPALAPAFRNLGIIFGALVLVPLMGVEGLAWGTVIGAALHFLIQLPGLIATRFPYRPVLTLRHPGVWEILRLMGPRILGLAIVQINFWVNIVLASGMAEGSISVLNWAWFVMLLPQGVIAQSVATAVFPTFSAQVSEGRTDDLKRTVGQVLRAVLFLAVPATVGLIVLRLPVVRLIYERGAFTPTHSQAVSWALLFFALGLVSHSLVEIITRSFYAMHDTRTPVLIGGGAMILNVVFSLIFIRLIGDPANLARGAFAGLALANTLATTLEGMALLLLFGRRIGGLEWRRLGSSLLRTGLASAGMGLSLWAMLPLIDRLGLWIGTLGGMALGGAIFWGLALLLGSETARLFTRMVVVLNR